MAFTYFFRDVETLRLIARGVLPALRGYQHIDVWDAGCAHGPEPFSLAITLAENVSHFVFRNVRIFATDIDTTGQFAEAIAAGAYPEREIKRIPPHIRRKYFGPPDEAGRCLISERIRARVEFIKHDLLSLEPVRGGMSLIVCKNVLLHFGQQQRADVVRMFHRALRKDGFLVTEQTQRLPGPVEGLFEKVTCEGQIFRKLPGRSERLAA